LKILEEAYLTRLEECKNYLYGSIVHMDVGKKLDLAWKSFYFWKVISLGKEFYEFLFTSLKDLRCVLAVGSWNLSPGFL